MVNSIANLSKEEERPPNQMKSSLDIEEQRRLKIAFGMEASDDETDKKSEDFERQVEIIFEGRARDMRYWYLLIILPNTFHQVINLSKTEGANQITIQTIYWLCGIMGSILTCMSTRPGRLMMVKYANIILTCRNILRLYNFEQPYKTGETSLLFQ